jgi:hypothetical protein
MIEFNLKKHTPQIVYDVKGTSKYLCNVRKMLIQITPEEKVRQAFLNYLITEIKIPKTQIRVEEPVLHHQHNDDIKHSGRIDILILDPENIPFIIYECKRETECFTDNVYQQTLDYFKAIKTIQFIGVVIGNFVDFIGGDNSNGVPKMIKYSAHPNYNTLCFGGDVLINEFENEEVERLKFKEPIELELIEELYEYNIIGEGTDRKLLPFLINLFGWILDEKDEFENNFGIQDIGVIFEKFGNAGGSSFAKDYRRFLLENHVDKPLISIGLTCMSSGENSPIGTSLLVGIGTEKHSHSSLQLRCDNFIEIKNNIATIWHDGTITVGKLGAAKRQDLLDFISTKENSILFENKIILGKIDFSEEIKSGQNQTKEFIKNLIEYALLRDDYRDYKKRIAKK